MARPFSNKKKPAPKKPGATPQAAAAFDKTLPEIEALSPDRLIAINLDIPRVVSQVLGVLPGLGLARIVDPIIGPCASRGAPAPGRSPLNGPVPAA